MQEQGRIATGTIINFIIIIITVILITGCIQDKSVTNIKPEQDQQNPTLKETAIPGTEIERISSELDIMRLKGWNNLAGQLGQPKTTSLLWYHLKTSHDLDIKMVFGNPNKLNSALAILVSKSGESALPRTSIKGSDYYIIDPMTPAIIADFKFGDMFDDPGGGNNFLAGNFRLRQEDTNKVEQWVREMGIDLRYSDIQGK
ncbi:Uncharacterised protein [uncultured archaeon]|nr:Uncharacterised protein [uncultured archaeon]